MDRGFSKRQRLLLLKHPRGWRLCDGGTEARAGFGLQAFTQYLGLGGPLLAFQLAHIHQRLLPGCGLDNLWLWCGLWRGLYWLYAWMGALSHNIWWCRCLCGRHGWA